MKTPLNSVLLVLIASFIGSFGALFLKLGSKTLTRSLGTLLLNWRLAAGAAMFLLSSLFFIKAVSAPGAELSVLYPMVALSYVWAMIWSRLFLAEPFTRPKFVALGLIICGIAILQLGNR